MKVKKTAVKKNIGIFLKNNNVSGVPPARIIINVRKIDTPAYNCKFCAGMNV
ncbi:MAG: hypothetical protein FWG13_06540 [Leptospirales bacterium]|nr:hypothetical protein [Leptospirales bacterium]